MSYKIILAVLLFIASYTGLQAQGQLEDVVHLKDGKVIKGKVLEYNPQETIKIKILGGSVLVYKSSEVEKIEKEEKETTATTEKEKPNSHQPSDVGLYHTIGGGTSFGATSFEGWGSGVSLTTSTGWSFHRMFGIGAGVGAMAWNQYAFLPVYANIRGNFMKSSTSLFYDLNVGYGIPLRTSTGGVFMGGTTVALEEAQGGLYLRPAIGVRFSSKRRTHVFLDVGYVIQYSNYEYLDTNNNQMTEKRTFYRPSIRVGVVF